MNESKALLATLSNAAGTPGNEGEIRDIIRQELQSHAEFSYDRLGSIICRRKNGQDAPKVMLAGHMDEVGFIVRLITKDGFIKFHNLGGWWGHSLLAQRVTIKSATGGVPGIIGAKPVHHLQGDKAKQVLELSEMHIDVGAKNREEVKELFGIRPGDHIVPDTEFREMRNPRLVSGKAFDDRVGIALVIEAFKQLAGDTLPNRLYGVGTVQEELGTRGAGTAIELVEPDVAIVLEGAPADDTPGFHKEDSQGQVGKGPQIRLFDPTMIANTRFTQYVLDTADMLGIPYQTAVRTSGGTDGRQIHVYKSGVPTIVIAPPVRYIHSHVGMLDLDDYAHTLTLILTLVRGLDAGTAGSFSDYS